MKYKKYGMFFLNVIVMTAMFTFGGCSEPKVIKYKPFPSNTYLYREIVDKNKLEWKASLFEDVKEYQEYIASVFKRIDRHKRQLQKEYNVKEETNKKQKNNTKNNLSYGDVIFDDEYSF